MIDFIGDIERLFHMNTANTEPVPAPVVIPLPPSVVLPALTKQHWPSQHTIWTTWNHPGTVAWVHENLTDVKCPWVLHIDKIILHSIQINKKCAASLERILQYIWIKAGSTQEAIEALHYDRYSGSYNYRPIRGASALSMHAYGLAVDFDDQENQQHETRHLFQDSSLIVEAFKAEGWVWGGDWSSGSIDAMHFQAAEVY